jgi:O-antigen ligase
VVESTSSPPRPSQADPGQEPPDAAGALADGPLWRGLRSTYALHLLTVWALAISNGFLGLTILGAPFALRARIPWSRLRAVYLPLGVYVLLLGAAVVASYDPRVSAGSLTELMSLSTLFLGPLLVRGERATRRLVDALVIVGAGIALFGLAQLFEGYGGLDRRIRGPFSHWMTYAGVLLICDLLLIARLSVDRNARRSWRWLLVVAISLGLVGSLTRGAWVAMGLVLASLLAVRRPRFLLALVPAALVFVLLAPVPVLNRTLSIADLRDPSNYDRLCMMDAGLRMIAERPLFGIGPDMVQRRYGLYRNPTAPRFWVPHLHNDLLHLTAERGLASLGAYAWLMGAPLLLAWRRYREQGGAAGPRADIYLGAMLGLAGFNLAGLFEYNWGDVEVQRLALFLLALPFCLETGPRDDAATSPK